MDNKLNILVLEDEEIRRNWFQKIFFKDVLVICNTAYEAINCLRNDDYDLIFLDRDLGYTSDPNNNGETVSKEIVRQNLSPNATIVVHTLNPQGQKVIGNNLKKTHHVEIIPYTQLIKLKREDFD